MLSVVRGRVAGGESLPRALAGAPGGPVSVQGLLADHDRAQRDLLGAGDAVQRLLEDPAVFPPAEVRARSGYYLKPDVARLRMYNSTAAEVRRLRGALGIGPGTTDP